MAKSLLSLCKYYEAGQIDQAEMRRQRAQLIRSLLVNSGDQTEPVHRLNDETLRPQDDTLPGVITELQSNSAQQPAAEPSPEAVPALGTNQTNTTSSAKPSAPVAPAANLNVESAAPVGAEPAKPSFSTLIQDKKNLAIGGGVLLLLLLVIIAVSGGDEQSSASPEASVEKQFPSVTVLQLQMEQLLNSLKQEDFWQEQELRDFTAQWQASSTQERKALRLEPRFIELRDEINAHLLSRNELNPSVVQAVTELQQLLLNYD